MEEESKRIIFNWLKVPSEKFMLVSFPMNMYRIKTKKFKYGLNFFQRAVLSLKAKNTITNERISRYLGIDQDLIELIADDLRRNKYLNEQGNLTEEGKKKLKDINGLVIDNKKNQIGYAFQFINNDGYYPYYVNDIPDNPDSGFVKTQKGRDYRIGKPFELTPKDINNLLPSLPNEDTLLNLIDEARKKNNSRECVELLNSAHDLSISLYEPIAVPVSVYAYIYMPKASGNEGIYETDWQVLDPFINDPDDQENSFELKHHLNSLYKDEINDEIEKRFGTIDTVLNRTLAETYSLVSKMVVSVKSNDFNKEISSLDSQLQGYLDDVLESLCILRSYYAGRECKVYIGNVQVLLERIFILDQQQRKDIYTKTKNEYWGRRHTHYSENQLKEYRQKRCSKITKMTEGDCPIIPFTDEKTKEKFIDLSDEKKPVSSLKHYMFLFALTHNDNPPKIFNYICKQAEKIYEIGNLRNMRQHANQKSSEKTDPNEALLTKTEIEDIYSLIKELINFYTEINI